MAWNKTVFDHTVITSQFLNDLQDYIIYLEGRIDALVGGPQLVPYQEERFNQLPTASGVTADVTLQAVLMDRDVVVGDVLIGTDAGTLAKVLDTDGQYARVVGLGERIGQA